jgi:ABC-type enterochelin transport system permease subunit
MAQRHEQAQQGIGKIFKNNLLGGIAWGLGATIGVSIILAIAGLILKQVNLIPVVGNFVTNVVKFISENNPHLLK